METPLLLGITRCRKYGHSHVLTLGKEVRTVMGIEDGDRIAFRKVGRYVFISVVRACLVAPISKEEKEQARRALGV